MSEPGPGAGGWDGEKAVVDTPASQGRYTRYSGAHMVSDSDISCFYNRGFCTSLVKKYIYCIDRMYDIYVQQNFAVNIYSIQWLIGAF